MLREKPLKMNLFFLDFFVLIYFLFPFSNATVQKFMSNFEPVAVSAISVVQMLQIIQISTKL